MDRKIKCEPLDPKNREDLVHLAENETKPIKSNAICGPGLKKPIDRT
ncbi:MAG: hypothetical protein WAX80_02930 [Minisyncoccia bacterium]